MHIRKSRRLREPESWRHLPARFGDRVKVRRSAETESAGFADRNGIVYGITTVSLSGVEVIGTPKEDTALYVFFEDANDDAWFAPELVELIDHDPGAAKTLDDTSGEWVRSSRILSPREWFPWMRGVFRRMLRH
jgi:hypothetical protein